MRAALAASVAILALGAATGAIADGDGGGGAASDAGAMPVVASDSAAPGDGWGVASSAGLTYSEPSGPGPGSVLDANSAQTILQNYQFLDPNVVEVTQVVEGVAVTTLSGVMLQKEGDDTSDPAALDEAASGVYSSGSAGLVPSLYGAGALIMANGVVVACVSGCDALDGSVAPSAVGSSGPVKTLASYASSATSTLLASLTYSAPFDPGLLDSAFPIPGVGSLGGPYVPPLSYPIIPPTSPTPPPPQQGGGDPPPPVSPGSPGNGVGAPGGTGQPTAVPEPGAWALMLIGVGVIGIMRRRRRLAAST